MGGVYMQFIIVKAGIEWGIVTPYAGLHCVDAVLPVLWTPSQAIAGTHSQHSYCFVTQNIVQLSHISVFNAHN